MKFKIKIIYLQDDEEYCCFVDGINGISGYGKTEEEAIESFENCLKKEFEKNE